VELGFHSPVPEGDDAMKKCDALDCLWPACSCPKAAPPDEIRLNYRSNEG